MALVLKDRVKQTAAAPGTGTITLSGSVTGFQSFSVIGNGNITYFAIYDPVSGDWEVNYGTYTSSGTTLTRNATPLSSSSGGSLVNFTGTVDVFVTYPSENAVWRDVSGVVVQQSFGAITATSAALTTGTISTAPVNNTDIVNKQYADAIASGIHFHEAVDLATTTALPANTYNNGTSGVGATLTANANGALSVDSTLTVAANRILVKNEVTQANNGVYTVTQVGSAGTPYILTRATDFDSAGTGVDQIDEGDFFLVTSGTVNVNTAWVQQTAPPIVVGTTALVFQQFAAPITYTAGTGLNESPTYTFNIATTGVSAATYGSASTSATIAVNAQGQITSASNTTIAINGTQVSGNITGQAGSVANALTAGTYLTSGGTYDGSAARTFAVDATATNTASKVVARDVSGNFAAGTITATLSGAATSAGTATNIAGGAANQIPYQTGAATTSFVVAPTVAGTFLNWNGSAFAYSAISLPNNATFNNGGAGDASGTTFNGSTARTISYNTVGASPLAGSSSLTTTGTVTSGTWSASFGAVSGANLTSLTAGNLSGTIPSAVLGNSTAYVGTTAVALNRASANLALTGISSVTLPGATSGTAQITPNAVAGTGTVLTLPATTGTLALTSDLPTVNNATLTMNTSGTGLSGSQTFTANQATGATFTVASNATNANTASTIVARDASGNFSAGTITATLSGAATSATTAGTITSQANSATITATSANTASQIVLRDASGNFSAGTITATLSGSATSAGTATTAPWSGITSKPSNIMYYQSFTLDANTMDSNSTGFTYSVNAPYTGPVVRISAGGSYDMWFNAPYSGGGTTLAFRTRNGDIATLNPWRTILCDSNYNSYAPTLTGTGASGTWGISVTGNSATVGGYAASTFVGQLGNSYYQANTWLQFNGAYGLYWPTQYGGHFGPNDLSTYTQFALRGVKNSYGGFYDQNSGVNGAMYDNGGNGGVYREGSGRWYLYHSLGNNCMGVGTSSTSSTYGIYVVKGGYFDGRVDGTIFYDANDTGYYVDPASTSRVNRVDFTNLYLASNNAYGFLGSSIYVDTVNSGDAGDPLELCYVRGTYTTTSGSMRAPLFYDRDDTAYYVDPASVSRLNNLLVNVGAVSNDNAGLRNVMPTGGSYVTAASSVAGAIVITLPVTAAPMIKFRVSVYTYDGLSFDIYCGGHNSSGYWYNTFAYMGTQNRSPLNVRFTYGGGLMYVYIGEIGQSWSYPQVFVTDVQVGYTNYEYSNWDNGWTITFNSSTYNNVQITHVVSPPAQSVNNTSALYGSIFYDTNNTGYYVDPSSTSNVNQFQSDRTYGFSDIRSPIFYDYNNTGYYVDPNSTSRMNTINADSLYSYGNVTAYSDERLKKDWEALPTNFVEELAKIKSGTYTRIDSGERQVGVGAQSLQAILKEAVSEKEEYLGVHYGNAAMVSAVELAKEVVDLRARVAQLESLISKLIGD